MNTSTIMDMIRQDPALMNDIPGFLARMNAKDIRRVDQVTRIVEEVVTFVSIAETNGGEATERDVRDAFALLVKQPLLEEVQNRANAATALIQGADLTDPAALVQQLTELQQTPITIPPV